MVMDVLVLAVFAATVFLCMRRGFALTVIHFFRCAASLLLAFFFCGRLRTFLCEETSLGAWAEEKLRRSAGISAAEKWQDTALYKSLPESLQDHSSALTSSFAEAGLDKLTYIIMGILSFLLIVIAVNLIAAILIRIFSRKYSGGFFGFLDWVLGGIMGVIIGTFSVFLFLALILPVSGLFSENLTEKIAASFQASYFAGDLYDNNFFFLLFRDFLN